MARPVKKEFKIQSILREKTSEKVHPKTLVVAALTAVTLAVVSSKLTGVVSSLVLVAMASIMTAVVSEFYRITLEGLRNAAQRAAFSAVNSRMDVITGELPVVTEDQPEPDENLAPTPHSTRRNLGLIGRRVFVSRWAVPMVFMLVATGTVMGSYVASQMGTPNTNIVQKIVEKKDVSPAQVTKLQNAAQASATRAAEGARSDAMGELDATKIALEASIAKLTASLAAADAKRAADVRRLDDQQILIAQLQASVDKLTQVKPVPVEPTVMPSTTAPSNPPVPSPTPTP